VHGVGPGLVAAPQTDRVTIELTGPRPDVESVTPGDLAAFVDCSGRTAGVFSLAVNVVGRDADKIKTVSPAQTVVVVDRYGYRMVPVLARGADGATLANAAVAPSTIEIAGGASAVAQVVAAEVTVPEPGALPAGFAAVMKPEPVDARMQRVAGVSVLGVVRVTGPQKEGS
jgi:YbbR domain-containing protein